MGPLNFIALRRKSNLFLLFSPHKIKTKNMEYILCLSSQNLVTACILQFLLFEREFKWGKMIKINVGKITIIIPLVAQMRIFCNIASSNTSPLVKNTPSARSNHQHKMVNSCERSGLSAFQTQVGFQSLGESSIVQLQVDVRRPFLTFSNYHRIISKWKLYLYMQLTYSNFSTLINTDQYDSQSK